jgi:CRISPR/Cas system-associated exonuclease Cas4 (RecB family)
VSEGLPRDKTSLFLLRFPEYRRTLRLAVFHEESSAGIRFYKGWRWQDVETPPNELPRLVIEEIAMVYLRTKHSTYYLLRDREAVKEALRTITGQTVPAALQILH